MRVASRVASQQPPGLGQRRAPAEEVLRARLTEATQRARLVGAVGYDLGGKPAPLTIDRKCRPEGLAAGVPGELANRPSRPGPTRAAPGDAR
eukprot:9677284-Lingulodinium_polyedra.AAC.1